MIFIISMLKSYIILLLLIIKIKSKDGKMNENIAPNIAVIPFKIYYPPKLNNYSFSCKDYLDTIHQSLPYLEIEIGESIKKIKLSKEEELKIRNQQQFIILFLEIDDSQFYIDDNYFYNEEKKLLCRYSSELSTSYEIEPSKNIIQDNKNYVYASDYIKIFTDKILSKYDKIKIEFKHNYYKGKNISFACGKAGLYPANNEINVEIQYNFLRQIHHNLNNVDYSFSFQFKNNDGLLIIGEESLEKKNKEDLISIYIKQAKYGGKFEWRFAVDQITLNEQYYEFEEEDFIIRNDLEGIEVPYSFYNKLNYLFFKKYFTSKICQTEIVNNFYIVISCNSDKFTYKDINNFPEIKILKHKIGYNFTFNGEELFYQKNNMFIFKIISYLEKFKTDFKLGRIFLKKYKVIFNPDSKSILFYKNYNIKIEKDNKTKKNIALITLSYIFIGLLFLLAGIYFGRKFCNSRRKIYANELEDNNYVYESKYKVIKSERKLIEL